MDQSQPDWLTEDFLKFALANGEDCNMIKIVSYSSEPAVAAGNNFCSVLYRTKVSYLVKESETVLCRSLIIKSPLTEVNDIQTIADDAKFLSNECNFYSEILPKLYETTTIKFAPNIYPCKLENFLVMEDLKENNYVMGDRLKFLDYEHCKAFLMTLAKFHASTFALHKVQPKLVENNGNEPLYHKNLAKSSEEWLFKEITLRAIIKLIENLEGFEHLAASLTTHIDSLPQEIEHFFKRPGKINVLNHGDSWTNNMLFQMKNGRVTDTKMIDFQIRRYGSFSIDLMYFLLTSPNKEVRENHLEELINIYRETLNLTLSELGCTETLSERDVKEELVHASPWAIHIISLYLLLILMEPSAEDHSAAPSEENLTSLDIHLNPQLQLLRSQTYNAMLPVVCKQMISFGILDFFQLNQN